MAVQNIEASGTIAKPLELEFSALSGSLTVMSKGMMKLIVAIEYVLATNIH